MFSNRDQGWEQNAYQKDDLERVKQFWVPLNVNPAIYMKNIFPPPKK